MTETVEGEIIAKYDIDVEKGLIETRKDIETKAFKNDLESGKYKLVKTE